MEKQGWKISGCSNLQFVGQTYQVERSRFGQECEPVDVMPFLETVHLMLRLFPSLDRVILSDKHGVTDTSLRPLAPCSSLKNLVIEMPLFSVDEFMALVQPVQESLTFLEFKDVVLLDPDEVASCQLHIKNAITVRTPHVCVPHPLNAT